MARDRKRDDSVYDFLYVDARRVAVFLSQFGPYGYLTSLSRGVSNTSTKSGDVNVAVVKEGAKSSAQTSQTSQFDPQWLAPLLFLDQAGKRGMIVRGLNNARMGQLVLVSGRFAVFDLGIIRGAWDIDVIRDAVMEGPLRSDQTPMPTDQPHINRRERDRIERARRASIEKDMKANIEFLKLLPHAILATVLTAENDEVWCSLADDNLIMPASQLMIKHGLSVSGEWNMVGVLDAVPDSPMPTLESDPVQLVKHAAAASALGGLSQIIAIMAPLARVIVGRPATSFGMTPLLSKPCGNGR